MRDRTRGYGRAALLACALAGAVLAACGEGRTFTAEEFVEAVNEEGVELRLGDELVTDQEGKDLRAVELEPLAQLPGGSGHAGGSLAVLDDTDDADEELATCKAAADLLCYRAANVVVVLEGGGIEAQRLAVAIERIAED